MISRVLQSRGLKLISSQLSDEARAALKSNTRIHHARLDDMRSTMDMTKGERIAKRIAAAGVCSRRQAEVYIESGNVCVNGKTVRTPATKVVCTDQIMVHGETLPDVTRTKVWMAHKLPSELITRTDPKGRATIFDRLALMGLPAHMIPVVRC